MAAEGRHISCDARQCARHPVITTRNARAPLRSLSIWSRRAAGAPFVRAVAIEQVKPEPCSCAARQRRPQYPIIARGQRSCDLPRYGGSAGEQRASASDTTAVLPRCRNVRQASQQPSARKHATWRQSPPPLRAVSQRFRPPAIAKLLNKRSELMEGGLTIPVIGRRYASPAAHDSISSRRASERAAE
jgi:hypothetical protein